MLSALFHIILSLLTFLPVWLTTLIAALILFLGALFIWRLIK